MIEYSPEDLAYLKAHYITNEPVDSIAEALGRTENAIRLKASRLGLKRPLEITQVYFIATSRCYGRDFDESCVDKCPTWEKCLDIYTENVKEDLKIGR